MGYFEKMLLTYLWDGQLEMKITGFDVESFEQILCQEMKLRLDMIERIVHEDDDFMPDTEKVEAIKRLFQNEFYDGE